MSKIKVVYDYQCLLRQKYGGISRYFYELTTRIERKANVSVYVKGSQNYYFSQRIREHNYKNGFSLFFVRFFNWINIRVKLIKDRNEINVFHPTYYVSYASLFFKRKIKYVITVYDMIPELFWKGCGGLGKKYILWNKKKSIINSDHIIAISEKTKEDILRFYPEVSAEKISVVYLASDYEEPIPYVDMREQYGDYILYVGNRNEYKNFACFVDAIKFLKTIYNEPIKIICVGGGVFNENEREILRKACVEQMFTQLTVSNSELFNLYKDARCFVYPSLYEGFGIPILEAFASGCPVVLSNCSCFPEIAGEAAAYFEGTCFEEMALRIKQVLEDEMFREALVRKGYERYQLFSWDRTAEETWAIYERILGEGK